MEFFRPAGWNDALEIRGDHPEAVVVAGATDVLVDINFGRLHPRAVLDLTGVAELVQIVESPAELLGADRAPGDP